MRLGDLDDLKETIEEYRKPKVYSEADERQNIIVDCILYIIDNAPTVELPNYAMGYQDVMNKNGITEPDKFAKHYGVSYLHQDSITKSDTQI